MSIFLVVLHVIVCIALILIVLLQTGKGASMGAAFGGSSQTVFGGAGPAPFLGKITTVAAIIFMITSLSLAYLSVNPIGGSIMKGVKTVAQPPVNPPAESTADTIPAKVEESSVPVQDTLPEAE